MRCKKHGQLSQSETYQYADKSRRCKKCKKKSAQNWRKKNPELAYAHTKKNQLENPKRWVAYVQKNRALTKIEIEILRNFYRKQTRKNKIIIDRFYLDNPRRLIK